MVFHKRLIFNVEGAGLAAKQQSYRRIPDWLQSSNPTIAYRIGCVALSPNAGPQPSVEGELQAKSSDRFAICFFLFPFCSLEQARFANRKQKNPTYVGLDLGWWRIPDSNR